MRPVGQMIHSPSVLDTSTIRNKLLNRQFFGSTTRLLGRLSFQTEEYSHRSRVVSESGLAFEIPRRWDIDVSEADFYRQHREMMSKTSSTIDNLVSDVVSALEDIYMVEA